MAPFRVAVQKSLSKLKDVDLRSDTVTRPCKEMMKHISKAKVGDDVFGEDPTVKNLQHQAAKLLGKDCSLFVPSATMANLLAIAGNSRRGDEIIVGNKSHIFNSEGGNASAYMSVALHTLPNLLDGSISIPDFVNAIREDDIHYPRTSMISLENTHMEKGGRIVPQYLVEEVAEICKLNDIVLHLDGARLANAAIASKTTIKELANPADTVTFCFSKGLGAPVGAVIAGNEKFIYHATRARKSLGGGMRQSGILAAAAIYALENNINRLKDDHHNAFQLAKELSTIPGISCNSEDVQTNIVFFSLDKKTIPMEALVKNLETIGIQMLYFPTKKQIRAVTHRHISEEDIDFVIKAIRLILLSY